MKGLQGVRVRRRRRSILTPGNYRYKIMFQKKTLVDDGRGSKTETWADAFPWFVSIGPLSFRESSVGEQIEAKLTHRVEGLYNDVVTSDTYRIKHFVKAGTTKYYNIKKILPVEGNISAMVMFAEEVVGKEK